jgi:hypothetical protein
MQNIRPVCDRQMADILPFKKKTPAEKHRGKSLCRSGFHKWKIINERKFDVKQGKLVTVFQCIRCGKLKTTAM